MNQKSIFGVFSGSGSRAWLASIGASLISLALLILSYAFSPVSWLAWFAFVPYLIASRASGRARLYIITVLTVMGYFCAAFALNGLLPVVKTYNIAILSLIVTVPLVELQLAFRRFEPRPWGWLCLPVCLTALAFAFMTGIDSWPVEGLKTVLIYPASIPVFRVLSGSPIAYALFFLVASANVVMAATFANRPAKTFAVVAGGIAALGAVIALAGGCLGDLPRASPESVGIDGIALTKMGNEITSTYPSIRAVVVSRGGKIVYERHYRGSTPWTLQRANSATKSVTGTLVGIAKQKGFIQSLDRKVLDYFPEYAPSEFDPRASALTLKHLLSFTSGYQWNDNRQIPFEGIYNRDDWCRFFLSQPFNYDPGVHFNYNSFNSHLLSAIVNRSSGLTRSRFPERYLWGPLGIPRRLWPTDGRGASVGGWALYIRTRDMAKLGNLWLQGGKWNGEQIIDPEWLRGATVAQSSGGMPCGERYGWQFWVSAATGYPGYFANGFGGQYIYVVPALDIVVAISSDPDVDHGINRRIVADSIVPAIVDAPRARGD